MRKPFFLVRSLSCPLPLPPSVLISEAVYHPPSRLPAQDRGPYFLSSPTSRTHPFYVFPKSFGRRKSQIHRFREPNSLFLFLCHVYASKIRAEIKPSSLMGLLPVHHHHSRRAFGQPNHLFFLLFRTTPNTCTNGHMSFLTHAFFPSE